MTDLLQRVHVGLLAGAMSLAAYLALIPLSPVYDRGGFVSLLFAICYVVSWPFRAIARGLTSLSGGEGSPGHVLVTVLLGALVFVAVDQLVSRLLAHRS